MTSSRRSRLAALGAALAAGTLTLSTAPATALTGGSPVPDADTTHAYTAKITIGEHHRGCSGSLVAPLWVITAASCFSADPSGVTAGKPEQATTATIGRPGPATGTGAVREVVELVPRADRDLVLARLAEPVHDVRPVALADTPPAAGDSLTVAGYGRTDTVWAPMNPHTGSFTVDAAPAGTDLNITGQDGAAVCPGDAGGPAVRLVDGTPELVAVNSRSWQGGCLGVEETRTGAVSSRTDDIAGWIRSRTDPPSTTDFNDDGADDIGLLYDYGTAADGRRRTGLWTFTSTGGTGFDNPVKKWDSADSGRSWTWARSKPVHGDFNGDGKDDVAVLYDNGEQTGGGNRSALWTFTSTGDDFTDPVRVWDSAESFSSWTWAGSKPMAGDFDGDGRDDIAVLYDYGTTEDGRRRTGLWTFTSTGTGFANPVKKWDSADSGRSWTWASSTPMAGDHNGDGKDDITVLYDNGKQSDGRYRTALWHFTSTGNDFTAPARVWDSATDTSRSWTWASSKPVSGDFNGDGKDDVAVLYNRGEQDEGGYRTALWTFTSTGDDYAGPVPVWDSAASFGSWTWANSAPMAGDHNGDGKDDITVLYDYGEQADGKNRTALWSFTSTGDDVTGPVRVWDSAEDFGSSWTWSKSNPV
ncbi:trypsin-like serine protease [Streptomyces sp. KLOTTS4A1]|uniref:trypsin-like serine protease n=1 Tax=Streptomyces sp. KLOTTS4A1 TaxID=3390996 RepID=UPI0039F5E75F